MQTPDLGPGGRELWQAITEAHPDLDPAQHVQLTEACRAKDRLDALAADLAEAIDDRKLASANATANLMKQLLAAMRLPDEAGKRPQQRGGARGSYAPKTDGTAAAKAKSRWGA